MSESIYWYGNIAVELIDGKWWVYEYDESRHQVLSVGASNPYGGGRWFANGRGEGAIKYVGRSYDNLKSAQSYARNCQ